MSRKSNSFSQLYDYLTRDKSNHTFTRNTYSNAKNKKELINEFMHNAKYLKGARGKVSLYHELLSLEANTLSLQRQKEILLDMAENYLKERADNHLSYGVIHEDKEHMHLHLMISANEIEGEKRIRLSKSDYSKIQNRLEAYKNYKYSELGKSSFYKDKKDLSRTKRKEQEIKHKRGKRSLKENIAQELKDIFAKATTETYLKKHLASLGYTFYTRGGTTGVIYEKRKYRLKTLGVEQAYKALYKKFEQKKQREIRRQKVKNDRSNSKFR